MKRKIFTLLLLFSIMFSFGQQNYWSKVDGARNLELRERRSSPVKFLLYQLDLNQLKADLANAPQRFSKNESLVIKFPDADGNFRNYVVQENSIMEPELQAKFPEIRSYIAWEKNKPENNMYIAVTPEFGLSLMYLDNYSLSYMDSYTKDNSTYIVYKRGDIKKTSFFECGVKESLEALEQTSLNKSALIVQDGNLRTYRLALSATGEYTTFHGGTVAAAMAAMTTTMNRVNGVFEKQLASRMIMVGNNNLIVYTNASTDPFSNGNPGTMINQNQTNTDNIIGSANYDIGHVFGTNSGGLAGLGVICTASKARGVTGSGAPVGDPFDIDYVAHEMGHQYGADHTFNGTSVNCGGGNRAASSAYEPGSGSTIMGYAGICTGEDVQMNSDPYFHARSILQMYTYITGSGNSCAALTATGNNEPTANAGADYIIPKSTAFVLTGTGSDPDGDAITYLWEQYDLGAATSAPPVSTATTGPLYRSRLPSTSNNRYFPLLSSVVANNLIPTWEVTPSVARTLNFSLLVGDNKVGGGQSSRDLMVVTVTNDGPFTVTSHTTSAALTANTATTVTWNVAGTNAGTINTQNVDIVLSTDGGLTFNTVLLANTPNDGTQAVTLPNQNVANARIMVRAVGNIYYALNSSNFSITGAMATNEVTAGNSFSIYPNPATSEVTIMPKNRTEKGKFLIHDAAGRLIKQGNVSGETKIRLDGFQTGNYIINVELENGEKHSEKLIVKK